jgi:signal transduction histidine kinase
MRILPRSLKGQLILITLAALLLSQFASVLFILDDQKSRMKHEWVHNIVTRIATVKDVVETAPGEYRAKIMKSINTWGLRYTIDSRPIATPGEQDASEAIRDEIKRAFGDHADQVAITLHTSPHDESQIELFFGDFWRDIKRRLFPKTSFIPKPPARPSFAYLSIPLQSGEWLNAVVMARGMAPPATPLLVQLATMLAISAIGIIFVLGRLTRPLKELARAASVLGRGETSTKLDEKGPSEVVETIRAFNDMQGRLTTFIHDRAKMLAALGHDLRTPITTLRLRAEFIEDEEVRDEILRTLDEMHEMAESTLSFAREEAAQEKARLVDANALISTICADLADAGLDVTFTDPGRFAIRCRPVGMKRAVRNIIENAVTYGRRARVSACCQNGEAVIVVDDDGPGIPDGDMEKVFKPFVRLEQSRNKDTGGVGLGLAIARSIVRSHGGEILLQNRPEGGLRVIVTLASAVACSAPFLEGATNPADSAVPQQSASQPEPA